MDRLKLICLLLVLPSLVHADIFTLERFVIGANGGAVSGGEYRLNFTVGESVVGSQSGTDEKLNSGFWWEVLTTSVGVTTDPLPTQFGLRQNSPNPFTTHTVVRYAVPVGSTAKVSLGIYDLRGGLVRTLVNHQQSPGNYTLTWNGTDDQGRPLSAGIYFMTFEGPGFRQHRRVVVLR